MAKVLNGVETLR